jgi:hypothetical protein
MRNVRVIMIVFPTNGKTRDSIETNTPSPRFFGATTQKEPNTMNASQKTANILRNLASRGISLTFDEVNTLRRAELTLHRWAENECGNSNNHMSWAIERDDETGKPFLVKHLHQPTASGRVSWRVAIADREAGALRRIKAICDANGLYFWQQMDPRGCALFVHSEPLTDSAYTNGIAIC